VSEFFLAGGSRLGVSASTRVRGSVHNPGPRGGLRRNGANAGGSIRQPKSQRLVEGVAETTGKYLRAVAGSRLGACIFFYSIFDSLYLLYLSAKKQDFIRSVAMQVKRALS
jgi:hypothetical protein